MVTSRQPHTAAFLVVTFDHTVSLRLKVILSRVWRLLFLIHLLSYTQCKTWRNIVKMLSHNHEQTIFLNIFVEKNLKYITVFAPQDDVGCRLRRVGVRVLPGARRPQALQPAARRDLRVRQRGQGLQIRRRAGIMLILRS